MSHAQEQDITQQVFGGQGITQVSLCMGAVDLGQGDVLMQRGGLDRGYTLAQSTACPRGPAPGAGV